MNLGNGLVTYQDCPGERSFGQSMAKHGPCGFGVGVSRGNSSMTKIKMCSQFRFIAVGVMQRDQKGLLWTAIHTFGRRWSGTFSSTTENCWTPQDVHLRLHGFYLVLLYQALPASTRTSDIIVALPSFCELHLPTDADSTQTEEHHSEHEKGNIRCQPDAKDALRCSSQESEVVSHHVEVSPCHHE